jgi:AraC-like DNA-binding protein
LNTILLLASIFGFVLTSIIFSKTTGNKTSTFFLGGFYLLFSFYALQTYIINIGELAYVSYFFLWPIVPYNLICVPIYFYFTSVMEDGLTWKTKYIWLFVPFFLGVIDVCYVYVQPPEVYNTILQNALVDPLSRIHVHYLILGAKEHFLLRHVWQFGVLIILFPQIIKFIKKERKHSLKRLLNKWLLFFWATLVLMSVFAIMYSLQMITNNQLTTLISFNASNSLLITLLFFLVIFSTAVIPVYFTTLFQGYPQLKKRVQEPVGSTIDPKTELKYGLEKPLIAINLERLKEKKLHLEQDFNITTCARELGIPTHHLSYYLNKYYGLSFATYKNQLRIEEAKKLIQMGFLEKNTMEALAWKCGFANRSSFSKVFKMVVGKNPTEYLQN